MPVIIKPPLPVPVTPPFQENVLPVCTCAGWIGIVCVLPPERLTVEGD